MKPQLFIITILLACGWLQVAAQTTSDTTKPNASTYYLRIAAPGFAFEIPQGQYTTLLFDVGFKPSIEKRWYWNEDSPTLHLVPCLSIETRYYVNPVTKNTDTIGYFHRGTYGSMSVQLGRNLKYKESFINGSMLMGYLFRSSHGAYLNCAVGCGANFMDQKTEFGVQWNLGFGIIF